MDPSGSISRSTHTNEFLEMKSNVHVSFGSLPSTVWTILPLVLRAVSVHVVLAEYRCVTTTRETYVARSLCRTDVNGSSTFLPPLRAIRLFYKNASCERHCKQQGDGTTARGRGARARARRSSLPMRPQARIPIAPLDRCALQPSPRSLHRTVAAGRTQMLTGAYGHSRLRAV
jgi:hypothetical protein